MNQSDIERMNEVLEGESSIRERIKEQVNDFDKKARTIMGLLNRIHSTPTNSMPGLLDSVRPHVRSCQDIMASMASIVTPNQFWRYKDMWQNSLRNVVFAVVLVEFLATHKMASIESVSEQLGIKTEWHDRLTLAIEDYLHGLISVVNELSRLAVNSVTLGDFEEPLKISIFVKDIFAGFSMLNLKNDTLRRRFDSIKYDIKKIEEVVYDVSLRKLSPVHSSQSSKE